MWRSLFCALGVSALLLGGEFLLIERATLTLPAEAGIEQGTLVGEIHDTTHSRDFVPPDWAPWTLLTVGTVVVLYTSGVGKTP